MEFLVEILIGIKKFTSKFLKKFISSKIFKIMIKHKNIKMKFIIFIRKSFIK